MNTYYINIYSNGKMTTMQIEAESLEKAHKVVMSAHRSLLRLFRAVQRAGV